MMKENNIKQLKLYYNIIPEVFLIIDSVRINIMLAYSNIVALAVSLFVL